MSQMQSAEIYVTKLAAAKRQLSAAIRLYFQGEDELAIHTIASASYRVLSDLKTDRGLDEASDYYFTSVFYIVRDYHRGTLPASFMDDPDAMRVICELADSLSITATSSFRDFNTSVSPQFAANYWRKRNRSSNFLKHADKDARAAILSDDIDNLNLLMVALGAYIDLFGENIWPEGYVLGLYQGAFKGREGEIREELRRLSIEVEKATGQDRRDLCAWILNELRQFNGHRHSKAHPTN
jgi:hypothetical protein